MKYYDVQATLDAGEHKDLAKLLAGRRNQQIEMFQDYYDGEHWLFSTGDTQTSRSNTTRSGKVMWEEKDKKRAQGGFTRGELKVWNVCDSTVDIYTSYCRGNVHDDNRVQIEGEQILTQEINDAIGDFNKVVTRSCHRMSVESMAVWKYRGDDSIEFVPTQEVFPVYDGDMQVGTVRIYVMNKNDPLLLEHNIKQDKRYYYIEVWMPKTLEEDAPMMLYKFINEVDISEGKNLAPYSFDPYIYVPNKDHEFRNFDEDNLEISDVAKIVDVQDDLNSFVTDLSIINRKVAIPMYKIASSVFEKMMVGDISAETVRRELEKLTLYAGRIMSAPIERDESSGIPTSSMQYLEEIFGQLYRATGIPKTAYISEGMGNLAAKTVEHLMESLKRKVDEKRTNIEYGVKEYATRYMKQHGYGEDQIESAVDVTGVSWADMFGITKDERADIIIKAGQSKQLPQQYVLEKMLDLLGDGERLQEVMGMMFENSNSMKIAVERAQIQQELAGQQEEQVTEARKEAEEQKRGRELLENEVAKLSAQL